MIESDTVMVAQPAAVAACSPLLWTKLTQSDVAAAAAQPQYKTHSVGRRGGEEEREDGDGNPHLGMPSLRPSEYDTRCVQRVDEGGKQSS